MVLQVAGIEVNPAIIAPLDRGFLPASLFSRKYRELAAANGGVPLRLALERGEGAISTFSTTVVPPQAGHLEATLLYVERIVKALTVAARRMEGLRRRAGGNRQSHQECLFAHRRAQIRLRVHGRRLRAHVRSGRDHRRGRSGSQGKRHAAGAAPGWLPRWVRSGRQRPQGQRRHQWRDGVHRRGGLGSAQSNRPRVSLPGRDGFHPTRRFVYAASGCGGRQRRGRLHQQPRAHRIVIPRYPQGQIREGRHACSSAFARNWAFPWKW